MGMLLMLSVKSVFCQYTYEEIQNLFQVFEFPKPVNFFCKALHLPDAVFLLSYVAKLYQIVYENF